MPSLKYKNHNRILVVDDDPNELKSLVIGLKLEGFLAIGASSGTEALEVLDKHPCAVMLVDLMMPKMNGLQLARTVKSLHPDVIMLIMSAYHLSPIQLARVNTSVVGFVPKPYSFEELVRFIKRKLYPENTPKDTASSPPSVATESGLYNPIDVSAIVNHRDSVPPVPGSQIRKVD